MAPSSLLLATSLLAVQALAKPVAQPRSSTNGFSVSQGAIKPVKPGVVQIEQALNKYNVPVPSHVASAASSAKGGEATATPLPYDEAYLVPVSVGGQTLDLDFDTGSADLWVFSSELSAKARAGHSYYTPSKSSTSKQLKGETWKISYGDGSSASGNVFADTVKVGSLTATSQAVEAAQTVSQSFQEETDIDGLVGLAFSSINTVSPDQQITLFDTSIKEGLLSEPLFTADLKKGKPGTYDFGYIDSSKHTGNITYAPVDDSDGFWSFTADGYGHDNSFASYSFSGIADTGTTLLLLDDVVVDSYYSHVKGAYYSWSEGGYVFPSSATLPTLVIGINGVKFDIPGDFLRYAPVDSSGTVIYGGLQSGGGYINIFGDIFLKALFVVFDKGNLQLGFATKNL